MSRLFSLESFLSVFNWNLAIIEVGLVDSLHLQLFSDASDWGCDEVLGPTWLQLLRSENWSQKHIIVKKYILNYLALDTWASHFNHSCLTFCCHNWGVVDVINAGTTKDLDMLRVL